MTERHNLGRAFERFVANLMIAYEIQIVKGSSSARDAEFDFRVSNTSGTTVFPVSTFVPDLRL